jgi:hypothetical protein
MGDLDGSPRLPKLEALMKAAERLTVELVAQEPYCVTRERPLGETLATAQAERFDFLPVRGRDGSIKSFVETAALAGISSWEGLVDIEQPIDVDLLVAESSPLFSLLERFHHHPILLVLTRDGIGGIVTVFDLNQPAAHQFAFGLALVIEAEVADVIRTDLRDGPLHETVDDRVIRELEREPALTSARKLRKWRAIRRRGDHIDVLAALGFDEKLNLLTRLGLAGDLRSRCVDRYQDSDAALVNDLRREVKELRNDIAHERIGLLDHKKMYERIRLTYELAHAFVYSSSR